MGLKPRPQQSQKKPGLLVFERILGPTRDKDVWQRRQNHELYELYLIDVVEGLWSWESSPGEARFPEWTTTRSQKFWCLRLHRTRRVGRPKASRKTQGLPYTSRRHLLHLAIYFNNSHIFQSAIFKHIKILTSQ